CIVSVDNGDTTSLDVSDETLDDVNLVEATADAGDDIADSSPAEQDEKTILSVVRDAAMPEAVAAPSAAENSDHQDEPTQAEPDNENFGDVPFHQHPRFRELIQQRNDLRTPAESYRKIES